MNRGDLWATVYAVQKLFGLFNDRNIHNKETKDLYSKNYKDNDKKKIKEDTNRWNQYIIVELEESALLKWLYCPRQSTHPMQSLSNYNIFVDNIYINIFTARTKKFKFSLKAKEPILKTTCRKKKKAGWRNRFLLQTVTKSYSVKN